MQWPVMDCDILGQLRQELLRSADEAVRQSGQRFFKEPVMLLGVKAADVKRIAASHFRQVKGKDKAEDSPSASSCWSRATSRRHS